jgi:hypothetical protein
VEKVSAALMRVIDELSGNRSNDMFELKESVQNVDVDDLEPADLLVSTPCSRSGARFVMLSTRI